MAKFGKQLYDNFKKMHELSESGRLPALNNRRLSASISSQRPRSSYSVASNTINEELPHNKNVLVGDSSTKSDKTPTDTNLKALNSSLLIRKDSITDGKNEPLNQIKPVDLKNESVPNQDKQQWKNTLNSLLESSNISNNNLKLNFTSSTKGDNTILEQNTLNHSFTSKSKPQLPQRMLDIEPRETMLKLNLESASSKNINSISDQLFKESFYDLPSPPIELLNVKQVSNKEDADTKTSATPSLARKLSLNNNLINQNKFTPPIPPKPTFKRTQSSERNQSNNATETNSNQIIGKDLLRRVSNRLSNGNFIGESNHEKEGKNQLISNELSILLERQKKKIEASDETKTLQNSESNSMTNIKKETVLSPTLAKKPPPPPRSDRYAQNRRNMHEN